MANKKDLVALVAESANVTKVKASEMIDSVIGSIKNLVASDDELVIAEFGNFSVRTRKAREGINPKTQEPLMIEETRSVSFRPYDGFKQLVNK